MRKRVTNTAQIVVFAILLAVAGALWLGQDQVGQVVAGFRGQQEESNDPAKSRQFRVVVARVGERADDAVIESIATARAKRFVTLYPEASGEIVALPVVAGQSVVDGDVIMQLDFRRAALAVKLAAVKVEEAQTMVDRMQQLLRAKVNPQAKVYDAQKVLERAKLELNQAEEALANRTLFAPFSGVLGIPKVEIGDRVSTTTAIVTVDERSELVIELQAPEEYIGRIKIGQEIEAHTPSFPDRRISGIVEKIDSRVEPLSRTVIVRAKIPNTNDVLRPGMSFAIELTIPGKTYPTVPELALQWDRGKSFVWRINKGEAEKVDVRNVKRLNSTILVSGPLRKGDLVVIEGVQRMRPGRAVTYALPDPAPDNT